MDPGPITGGAAAAFSGHQHRAQLHPCDLGAFPQLTGPGCYTRPGKR